MNALQEQGGTSFSVVPDIRLQQFRETFVDDCLRGILWLALCIVPISLWRNFFGPEAQRFPAAFWSILGVTLAMLLTYVYRRKVPYSFKSAALLCLFMLAGFTGLASFGQAGPTGNYFAMGFFAAAILFSRSTVFMLIAFVAGAISLMGYRVVHGLYAIPIDLNQATLQPVVWVNMVLTMALTAGAIATALSAFTRSVYRLLREVQQQHIEIETQRDQIRHLATHDNLTGLPVLSLAMDRSHFAMEHARRYNQKIGFMFIDLDGFKKINDSYGHDAGDCVLKDVAQRLRSSVRAVDTVARIGGDEFVIVLTQLAEASLAGNIAEKILRALSAPIPYDSHYLHIGASIGIAIFPDHAADLDALKKAADKAMYSVKTSGKHNFAFAKPDASLPAADIAA